MAFCRFGADGSDVYCFYSTNDEYEIWCDEEWTVKTAEEAIEILLRLRKEGKNIPEYAINSLKEEQ